MTTKPKEDSQKDQEPVERVVKFELWPWQLLVLMTMTLDGWNEAASVPSWKEVSNYYYF